MDQLKQEILNQCLRRVREDNLTVDELYSITIIKDIVQSDNKEVITINNGN